MKCTIQTEYINLCTFLFFLCCTELKIFYIAFYLCIYILPPIGVILFRALYLGGYDITKDHFDIEHASLTTRFIAAQLVTTIVGTVCFPIDTVKRRLMVQRKIIEKVAGTTPGAGTVIIPNLAAVSVSASAVTAAGAATVTSTATSSSSVVSAINSTLSAAAAKVAPAAGTLHPPYPSPSPSSPPLPSSPSQHLVPYKSGLDCVRRILAEEGIRGLYAGLSVNIVRGFSGAILLVAYDDLKQRL